MLKMKLIGKRSFLYHCRDINNEVSFHTQTLRKVQDPIQANLCKLANVKSRVYTHSSANRVWEKSTFTRSITREALKQKKKLLKKLICTFGKERIIPRSGRWGREFFLIQTREFLLGTRKTCREQEWQESRIKLSTGTLDVEWLSVRSYN